MALHPRIIICLIFIFMSTTISVIFQYNLEIKDVLLYILIIVTICAILSLLITLMIYATIKVREFSRSTTSESRIFSPTETESDWPFHNPRIVQILNNLSEIQDFEIKTLPTYNNAMHTTIPMKIVLESPNSDPPPEYTPNPPTPVYILSPPNSVQNNN